MNNDVNRTGQAVLRLQQWYENQCDGDWEHSFGITIDTLDNPGWILSIDLAETEWEEVALPLVRIVRSDSDWFQYEIVEKKFRACGGIGNFVELLEAFFRELGGSEERQHAG
ncbi:immunity 53 family protein [Luteibacter sp. SG786]|uniref:immunity 53 family protein n=1 Tax=Luteibacter sp. SG786 TaxID=2587130 RepID=UPI00141E9762|nr:immunity 53 family protein [Luteibacter sp. SG786]NII53796.1 hypothetical protein [Luteibacter sp. SG786]